MDNRSPITPLVAYSGEFWRPRAKLARDKIFSFATSAAQASLEKVASEYDKLADRADEIQRQIALIDKPHAW